MAARQERIYSPDIITLYCELLQRSGLIEPESSLPAPKNEIKAALIAEAQRLSAESNFDGVETIRACYSLLADFVADDIAARNRSSMSDSDPEASTEDIDALQPEDLVATSEEAQRLIREFDSQVTRNPK